MDTTNSHRLQSLMHDILLQQMQQHDDDDVQQLQQQQQQQQQHQQQNNFQITVDNKPDEQLINSQITSQLENVNSQPQHQQQLQLQPLSTASVLNQPQQQQQQQQQMNIRQQSHKKCKNCGRIFLQQQLQQQNQQQSQQTQQQRHRQHCHHRNELSVGYPVERVNNINRVIHTNNNNNNVIINANNINNNLIVNNNNTNNDNNNILNTPPSNSNLSNIKTRFQQILLQRQQELQQPPPITLSLPQLQQQQQQQSSLPQLQLHSRQQQQSSSIAVANIITSPPPFPPQTLLATSPPPIQPSIITTATTTTAVAAPTTISPPNSPKLFTPINVKPVGTATLNGFENDNNIVRPTLLAERYLLLDLVDGGSMYKCYDVTSHDELVCKIAKNPCSNLLSAHFRLDGHPHINPFHKIIQGTFQTYLFFLPSHGDLHSYVRVRRRLKEMEAKRLFRQMCKTVKACHEQGIVLRDLKLRKFVFSDKDKTNLRLESLEDAVVLDNPAEDLLQDKRGCPAYVSPEILKANTTYSGKAADMWSLGVILYTMLVGRYPFNDSEHASLFAKISRGHFLVPDSLSSKARCMIRALLRRDPEERITSEDVLFHPWLTRDETRDISRSSHDQCVPTLYFEDDDDNFKSN